MKKNQQFKTLILCLFAFVCLGTVNAQTPTPKYQLRNSDFEAPFVAAPGQSATGTEPPYWHSFGSLTGSWASTARSKDQISQSSDTRNGIGFSCKINARTVLLVATANGNMTTGRVNAGSSSPADAANHNFTDPADNNFNEPWTSTPDSIRFWAKYTPNSATQYARASIYIHDNAKFSDPLGGVDSSAYRIVASAALEWQRGDQGWHQYTIPFNYADYAHLNKVPKYILITFTTNKTPGSGNKNDALYIDDIEMVYSPWLTDLKINGQTVDDFQKHRLLYDGPSFIGRGPHEFPYQETDFSWTTEVADATVTVTNVPGPTGHAGNGYTSILVTAEDGRTKEYRINYEMILSSDNKMTAVSYKFEEDTPIPVPGFTAAQTDYSIVISNPEEVRTPQIDTLSIVLSDAKAIIQSITQPTSVNSNGVVVIEAENYKTENYYLRFSKTPSSNSTLNWIKIANEEIPDFDPDLLEYDYPITSCVASSLPTVTAEKASSYASVSYTQANLTTKTATITVTAEDHSQKTYTIHFVLTNNDVSFSGIRFGTTSANDLTQVPGQMEYEQAYSFTTGQNITLTPNCLGAVVTKLPANTVYYPDTNYFTVKAQDGITVATYKVILKNTNCYVATGLNNGFRYNYNGETNQLTGITITATDNSNTDLITTSEVKLPTGPNEPPVLVVSGLAASVAAPTYTFVQPTHRTDTAIVTLTANDGTTQKIYRVPFKETLSTDASLKSISYNGINIPTVTLNTLEYTVWLPANVTEVPEIAGIPNFQWLPAENIVVTPAEDLLGTTTITVTAEDGITTRTYLINFDVEPVDNAYLSVITYDGNVIHNFSPTTFNYTVEIPYSNTCPVVVGTPMAEGAHVFYNTSGTPPCSAEILVFSSNLMGMKIYTVTFVMVKNTNPLLADIKVNGTSLENFYSQTFNYNVVLPYTEMNAPVVTATTAYPNAHANIVQINTVTGTATINVTAEDEAYTEVYTLNISRELSPVTTINIVNYDYNDQSYTYEVTNNDTEFTIMLPAETEGEPTITEIILTDDRAEVMSVEQPDETNDFTGAVVVIAEDLTEKTYSVSFERALSESTLLTGIYYRGIPVPNFHPDTLTYHVTLDYNTSQVQNVTATAAWINTGIVITQNQLIFGEATVLVTSENEQNNKEYKIFFHQGGDAHLFYLSYNLDGVVTPVPGFDPLVFEYNIPAFQIGATAVPTLEYLLKDNRCTVDTVKQTTPAGTSQLKIATFDKSSSLTYSVNFKVTLSTDPALINLLVDGETIEAFNSNKLNYNVVFPYGTIKFPVVTAVAKYPDAEVIITQVDDFPGTATVLVKAGDTTITRTYTIDFSVNQGNNTYLQDLLIGGSHWYLFNKDLYFYKYKVPVGITDLPNVIGIPEDTTSTVTYEPAYPNYHVGDTVKIIVTSLNGNVATYYVYFFLEKNINAYASMIYVDWKPLNGFVRYISEYWVDLPADYTGQPMISVELEDPNASKVIDFPTDLPLTATITVTAEDGINTFQYIIHFNKLSILTYGEAKINVYPNPTTDVIHFEVNEFDQASRLEIYSLEGKKVGSHTLQAGNNSLNVTHLQTGIYLYKIFSDQTMLGAGKFIKN